MSKDRESDTRKPLGYGVLHPRFRVASNAVAFVTITSSRARSQSASRLLACGACADYGSPHEAGHIASPALVELSGLAASRVHPGIYYAHNDSGDIPRFFALDEQGTPRGEFILRGATALDWEDIAVGPCSTGSCVYLGDTGDNSRDRPEVVVYRVAEPAIASGSQRRADVAFERFALRYPDGAHDAESLVIDPTRGDVYILTKRFGGTDVYRVDAPLDAARARQPCSRPARFGSRRACCCGWSRRQSAHPLRGRRVVFATYDRAFELRGDLGGTFASIFRAPPREIPRALEFRGRSDHVPRRRSRVRYVVVRGRRKPDPRYRVRR